MLFHERQQFRQTGLWLVLGLVTGSVLLLLSLGAYRELGSEPHQGHLPMFAVVVAAALVIHASVLLLVRHARLDVTVTAEAVEIRFAPFHRRTRRIPVTDIADARRRHYRPLAEYGGWGIRLGLSGTAYNVSGSEGVQLVLTSGRRILIGSQRSGELEAAIRRARGG